MEVETDLRERVRALFLDCSTFTLATAGPEGPWAADLFFAPRGLDELIFISSPDSRHARNSLAGGAAAATVHPDVGSDWRAIRGLQMEGEVALVPEDGLASAREAYFAKFPFAAALLKPDSEVQAKTGRTRFFALQIRRLYLVDNRLGFGVRQELDVGGSD